MRMESCGSPNVLKQRVDILKRMQAHIMFFEYLLNKFAGRRFTVFGKLGNHNES